MADALREKALGLPLLPGVYIMKDRQNRVIYVGKALRLKNRVSSYFSGVHEPKTHALVSKIADFDFIVAASEFEALVLENSLIKHHMPKYNIKLRDDKGYPFIKIDIGSDYPGIKIVSKPGKDDALYLGPYSGRSVTREAIGVVSKALMLPTCGKNIKDIIGKDRPCLNAHIGTCRAYCQDAGLQSDYRESIDMAIDIFMGKASSLIDKLNDEMMKAAEELSFEIAAQKRDRLKAMRDIQQKQLVIAGAMADTDVVGFFAGAGKSCLTVLHFIEGKLISKDFEIFDTPIEEDSEAVSSAVRQYYEMRGAISKTILLPSETEDRGLLEQLFSEKKGSRVYVFAPKRGDKAELVKMANINAREESERASTQEEKTRRTLEWLRSALGLEAVPERIEAFDVSNTGDSNIVASMTVFIGGKSRKKSYKRFKIKTVAGQDDYRSMEEAVTRRIARLGDENFGGPPDLMLIDGGSVHASAIRRALLSREVNLPVFGMVKDEKHRTRALVSPDGEEIGLSGNPAVFALIGTIQEETHRFAVEYHRSLRSKSGINSTLDSITGVGEKRRNALLKQFGSIKAVTSATLEELSAVVPKNTAETVYEYFHKQDNPKE